MQVARKGEDLVSFYGDPRRIEKELREGPFEVSKEK